MPVGYAVRPAVPHLEKRLSRTPRRRRDADARPLGGLGSLLGGPAGARQVPAVSFLAVGPVKCRHGSAANAASGSRLIPCLAIVLSEARALSRDFRY